MQKQDFLDRKSYEWHRGNNEMSMNTQSCSKMNVQIHRI